jgi:hypothetical protein
LVVVEVFWAFRTDLFLPFCELPYPEALRTLSRSVYDSRGRGGGGTKTNELFAILWRALPGVVLAFGRR